MMEEFNREVEMFMRLKGMKPTAFGRAAVGDPAFVFELRKGREVLPRTARKVREFMLNESAA